MIGMETLDHIIEEVSVEEQGSDDENAIPSTSSAEKETLRPEKIQVTPEIIDEVCVEQAKNANSLQARRDIFKNISREKVFNAVGFLSDCIVPAGRFTSQAKEKTWSNYHQAFLKNRAQVVEVVGSSRDASFLCQKIIEKMIMLVFGDSNACTQQKSPETISRRDVDILAHIGGSIVQRQRQRLQRKADSESKTCRLELLEAMCSQDASQNDSRSLTETLNRGGLIVLTDQSTEFFVTLERNFRSFTSGRQENLASFHFEQFCSKDQELTEKFEASVYQYTCFKPGDMMDQERIFSDILQHFYRIRIHHACKSFMENCKSVAGSKSKKGLRKSLKKTDDPKSSQDL